MKLRGVLVGVALGFTLTIAENSALLASSPEENEMFSDSNTVLDTSASFLFQPVRNPDTKSVGLSGSVLTYMQSAQKRAYFSDWDAPQSSLSSGAVGTALLDIRMREGFKAFADLEWALDATKSDDSSFKIHVQETTTT